MCWAREGLWLIYCSVSLAQCLVHKKHLVNFLLGFPGGSGVKNLPANAGDAGSIPGLGRSSGEGNGNLLQCSCCEIPNNRGAWWATVHRVARSQTRLKRLSTAHTHLLTGPQAVSAQRIDEPLRRTSECFPSEAQFTRLYNGDKIAPSPGGCWQTSTRANSKAQVKNSD